MKNILFCIVIAVLTIACGSKKGKENAITERYATFGDSINDTNVMTQAQMVAQFKTIQPGDSIPVKFNAKVNAVCQAKGCWMKMDMNEEEAMVKFKDYGFFMPKDIATQEVIVSGIAFVQEMSVDEQKHYAKDAGKTSEEIAAITTPKRTLSVVSNGVLIPYKQ